MIYFAHALETYNTAEEQEALTRLQDIFKAVFNPNTPEIQRASNPMQACIDRIDEADIEAVVCVLYRDKLTPGVIYEARHAMNRGKGVFLLDGEDIVELYPQALTRFTRRHRK